MVEVFIATFVLVFITVFTTMIVCLPFYIEEVWEWLKEKISAFIKLFSRKNKYKTGGIISHHKMMEANQLFECDECGRFTRRHILTLLKLYEDTKEQGYKTTKCPNCNSTKLRTVEQTYTWQKTHRHCYELNEKQYADYINLTNEYKEQIKNMEALQALEEYESKHLASNPKFNADTRDKQ